MSTDIGGLVNASLGEVEDRNVRQVNRHTSLLESIKKGMKHSRSVNEPQITNIRLDESIVPDINSGLNIFSIPVVNESLSPREQRELEKANVWLMDWEVEGYGALPAEIKKIADTTRKLTDSEKRTLLNWYYRTAPGDY